METAVEAMRLGAHDYILKPFTLDVILSKVNQALNKGRMIEADLHRHDADLAAKQREVEGLNRMFQAHLNERADVAARWSALSGTVHRIVHELDALRGKIRAMDVLEESLLPSASADSHEQTALAPTGEGGSDQSAA